MYSEAERGKPEIDPVFLFKIVLIQHLYGIRSMKQTLKEIEVNMAYRCFIGYDLFEKIPHFSTFSKNYTRRFQGTHVKASGNKKKNRKVECSIKANMKSSLLM